jgi:AcrR family transcriptional regulator
MEFPFKPYGGVWMRAALRDVNTDAYGATMEHKPAPPKAPAPRPLRLSRDDWILAGFRALVTGGRDGLRVEPVARALGATKGSFYWHFTGPADWQAAMLGYWEEFAFTRIVDALQELPAGAARLRGVITLATESRDPSYGGVRGEPALRDWARYDAAVAASVARIDAARVGWLAGELTAAGADAGLARGFYAALVGLQAMLVDAGATAAALNGLLDAMLGEGG